MFPTVFGRATWDCHADGGALGTTPAQVATHVAPLFDQAFAALLDDLDERGLLAETLVIATGEFGRSPRLNSRGGRDHWTGCWSALLAGAGLAAGQVVGRSDAHAAWPVDDPVPAAGLAALVWCLLGGESVALPAALARLIGRDAAVRL